MSLSRFHFVWRETDVKLSFASPDELGMGLGYLVSSDKCTNCVGNGFALLLISSVKSNLSPLPEKLKNTDSH